MQKKGEEKNSCDSKKKKKNGAITAPVALTGRAIAGEYFTPAFHPAANLNRISFFWVREWPFSQNACMRVEETKKSNLGRQDDTTSDRAIVSYNACRHENNER